MRTVGVWSLIAAFGVLAAWVPLGGCSDEDTSVDRSEVGGAAGTGGAAGAGGIAGESLDPPHCSFETPPTHATKEEAAVGTVMAGIGEARLDLPIGTPLGGYGARVRALGGEDPDKRKDRINVGMVPSIGMHDAPIVRAVAMEVGGEKLIVIRVDSIYVIDNTVFELEKALAPDGSLRGRVLVAGTHSHGAYAVWQGSYILMPGGNDRPREDMFQRVIASMKSAAEQALSNMVPAKIGVGVTNDFDPQDIVTSDRRSENDDIPGPDGNDAGKRKDGQAWVLRLDRSDGSPIVALLDFPVHGTITDSENLLATNDVPGAIERATTSLLGYPVIHLQGAGGDVTPVSEKGRKNCPDKLRCLDMPAIELVGARAAKMVKPLIDGVTTGDSAGLEIVTRSVRTGRNVVVTRPDGRVLSYAPVLPDDEEPDYKLLDEDGRVAVPVDEFNTEDGAGLCGDPKGATLSKLPGNLNKLGPYRSCTEVGRGKKLIFGLFGVNPDDYPTPGCDTIRITTTAVRLRGTPSGDYLITTVPGEPTAPLVSYIRGRSPAGQNRTLILGYAQDHIGYVLTAEDWLAGGYEPSINLWGPLEGEQVVEGVVEAAKMAWTPEVEDPEVGSSRYLDFKYPPPRRELKITVTSNHGTIVDTAPEKLPWPDVLEAAPTKEGDTVARAVGVARFVFFGGDPLVDHPTITIEVETGSGAFAPLKNERGEEATSIHADAILTYVPVPLTAEEPTSHAYGVTWQPVLPGTFALENATRPFSLPLGKYRLRARGKAQSATGLVDYDVSSPTFSVIAAPLSSVSKLSVDGENLTIQASLGDAPGLRALVEKGPSDSEIPLLGPWTITIKKKDGTSSSQQVEPSGGEAKIKLDTATIANLLSVEVRDTNGNGGVLTL